MSNLGDLLDMSFNYITLMIIWIVDEAGKNVSVFAGYL